MAANSKIEWTDATWNPVVGCTKCSLGCLNCYAERMSCRLAGMNHQGNYAKVVNLAGKWNGNIVCDESKLETPLHWRKGRRIFVSSMSDLFHEKVPFDFIDQVIAIGSLCPQHTLLILTKRAKKMLEYFTEDVGKGFHRDCFIKGQAHKMLCEKLGISDYEYHAVHFPLNNLHLGVSISNQVEADEKIPIFLKIPATVRWLSIEPMLGAIDIKKYLWVRQKCVGEKGCGFTGASYEFDNPKTKSDSRCPQCGKNHTYLVTDSIDWVVIGGESGPGARPMNPNWVRGVRDQCVAAGVPFFMKQWGEWLSGADKYTLKINTHQGYYPKRVTRIENINYFRVGKKKAGRLLDGREWNQLPKG